MKIKNIGGSQGRVIGIHGYNNNPNAYNPDPIWGDCEFRRLDDGINLDPGDTITFDYKYFLPTFYSGATCPAVTTSGYFWFFPDLRYINAEVVSFVLNNRSKSGKVPILELTGAIPLRAKIGFGVLLEQYPIEIYDFTGRKVISKDVSNVVEETDAAMGLPSGLYIIKSEKGDRKIFVD
ncbi:MAG: T9SS type A sorting domain-containing protein [Bacteroidota bacterium]